MLIFVTLSSILLIGALTGMLSNSFSRVISRSRDEYLFVYSVYVLEASTSNRLTHFYPPFNLLALVIFRPLRLFIPSTNKFRGARIVLLKATHLPIVLVIQMYEALKGKLANTDEFAGFKGPRRQNTMTLGSPAKSQARPRLAGRHSAASIRHGSRPVSASELAPRLVQSRGRYSHQSQEDTEMDPPSNIEVQISELSSKIDKLTEIVLRMQMEKERTRMGLDAGI